MKIGRFTIVTMFAMSAVAIAPAQANAAQWTVRAVESASQPLIDFTDAQNLLDGVYASRSDVTAQYDVINFNEQNTPLGGKFGGDSIFPGVTPDHQTDFAVHATAIVHIPGWGPYTFGVSSDDGFDLKVGGFEMSHLSQRYPGETYATFTFQHPGNYPIEVTYYQHLIAAELEVFSSPGRESTFTSRGADFELVGASSQGGLELASALAPEPTPLVLFVPTIGLALARRRAIGL